MRRFCMSSFCAYLFILFSLLWRGAGAGWFKRNDGDNGGKDLSLFNIVNGQIFTPGLAIIDSVSSDSFYGFLGFSRFLH